MHDTNRTLMVCYPCRPNTGELISFWTNHVHSREPMPENNQRDPRWRSLELTCDIRGIVQGDGRFPASSGGSGVEFPRSFVVATRQAPELCAAKPSRHRGRREDQASADSCGPRAERNARGRNHRFSRVCPAFPAQWCYGCFALSPGTGVLAPVCDDAPKAPRRHQRRDARTMRLDRPCRRRSSVGARPSITSHPNAPDDAQRPSSMRRDGDREP